MVCSSYRILVDLKNIVKRFAISKYDAKQIRSILEELSKDSDSSDIRPLSGYDMCYRARKGDMRFILTMEGRFVSHNNVGCRLEGKDLRKTRKHLPR